MQIDRLFSDNTYCFSIKVYLYALLAIVIDSVRFFVLQCGVISPRFDVALADMETWTTNLLPSRQFG